jgi:osmotically-inducible protein OsmY
LERRIGERLGTHPGITPSGIRVFVDDGWVLLSGNAESAYEKSRAEGTSSSVKGVVGVVNRLAIQPNAEAPVRDDRAIRADIGRELANDGRVDAELVQIDVRDGVATLRGLLPDYAMYDAVLENVFEALPREVENRLEVAEPPPSGATDLER